MTRTRLPNRRPAETVVIEHGGTRFTVTIGFYPDGRPGEVFIGVKPRDLPASMGRLGNAEPASIIGAVIDLAAAASPVTRGNAGEASA